MRNDGLSKRADHIEKTYYDILKDFEALVDTIFKYRNEPMDAVLVSKIHAVINEWYDRHFSNDRERGCDPRFSIVMDEKAELLKIVPANMAGQLFIVALTRGDHKFKSYYFNT